MPVLNLDVRLTPLEAADTIQRLLLKRNDVAEIVDVYVRTIGEKTVVVLVMEKYYLRLKGRASLTVTMDDLEGKTHVHAVTSGSVDLYIDFDWGATKSLRQEVQDALDAYIIK